jgi:MoaA/NifB/PqqE/SkfB family radical SAM enzyme
MDRRFREARMFARAMQSPRHPVMAQIIPTRRCNLSCAYCNEYDAVSPPVPTEVMLQRIDRLAALGTSIISISGGEPLLHPDLDLIVRRIRERGMIATLITNGYLLSRDRVRRLNSAGLDQLQVSIDNVNPDGSSKKSLKVLDRKLQWLAECAEFDVTVNTVLGSSSRNGEALAVARRAQGMGFRVTAGLLHDRTGTLQPLKGEQRRELDEILSLDRSTFSFTRYNHFQENLARGLPNTWQCRAGSRYLYICEDGLVHWCSQQRGYPGIPLEGYGAEDLEREYRSTKSCAPLCTIGCVHRVATLDAIRENPRGVLTAWLTDGDCGSTALPAPVRALVWMFHGRSRRHRIFSRLALRLFRL